MDTTTDQPITTTSAFKPYEAKRLFRALLLLFAGYWQQAEVEIANEATRKNYFLLLRACQDVLNAAPMHPQEARTANIEHRYDRALERLATTLNQMLPGGLAELDYYIVDDTMRERRRQRGLSRYRQAKKRQRTRRH